MRLLSKVLIRAPIFIAHPQAIRGLFEIHAILAGLHQSREPWLGLETQPGLAALSVFGLLLSKYKPPFLQKSKNKKELNAPLTSLSSWHPFSWLSLLWEGLMIANIADLGHVCRWRQTQDQMRPLTGGEEREQKGRSNMEADVNDPHQASLCRHRLLWIFL